MLVVNPHVHAERKPVEAVRTVTVLGATGSVGTSTVDLLKRGNGRYAVEAVTAHKNGAELAQIARDLNARFAVVADAAAAGHLLADLEEHTLDRQLPLALLPLVRRRWSLRLSQTPCCQHRMPWNEPSPAKRAR